MLKKIGLWILGVVSVAVLVLIAVAVISAPETPATDSPLQAWLQPGPYTVAEKEHPFLDQTRPMNPNRDFIGIPFRPLPATIWYPEGATGSLPLLLYAHGFTSSRAETIHVVEHLASHGYVVVAPDFPLTSTNAPGGPNVNDVSNQPEDLSFVIDSMLALEQKPFTGELDPERIGIMGLSLGGFTTSLTVYHPRLRDPRVRAAISMAGPSANLTGQFYAISGVTIPFLMIAGTSDLLIDYASNAAVIPERVTNGELLTIEGGNHIGFVTMAEPLLRLMHNSDTLACVAVQSNIEGEEEEQFADLFSAELGIVLDPDAPGLCEQEPMPEAGHPGRQHMITQIGVLSFFESVFASDPGRRREARDVLVRHLPAEFAEANFRSATVAQ
ncbi:MAG: dienelactone hydrolase family protein [Gammaproteobacteria bacterium]